MAQLKTVIDPLGNAVIASTTLLADQACQEDLSRICEAISKPNYLIETTNHSRYYFRLLELELNVMIEVNQKNGALLAEQCIHNPTAQFISGLLERGNLYAF